MKRRGDVLFEDIIFYSSQKLERKDGRDQSFALEAQLLSARRSNYK